MRTHVRTIGYTEVLFNSYTSNNCITFTEKKWLRNKFYNLKKETYNGEIRR